MKIEIYTDGLAIIPENAQDQAFLRDTCKISPEAGSYVTLKRINYDQQSPGVARLVLGPSDIIGNILPYDNPIPEPEKPSANVPLGEARRKRRNRR